MKIIRELLKQNDACEEQTVRFAELFPDGCEPTIENLSVLWAEKLSVFWLTRLLPAEGLNSRRHFAYLCAREVSHLIKDKRAHECLEVVRRRVEDPNSVSDEELQNATYAAADAANAASSAYDACRAAGAAAYDAYDVAGAAAYATDTAAYAAADAATYTSEREKQITFLSAMLMEVK